MLVGQMILTVIEKEFFPALDRQLPLEICVRRITFQGLRRNLFSLFLYWSPFVPIFSVSWFEGCLGMLLDIL